MSDKLVAENLISEFNNILREGGRNQYCSNGILVCDILKNRFPQYKFDTRIQGWDWFFIEDLWIRFFFSKDRYVPTIITHYDFYEPFYKSDN